MEYQSHSREIRSDEKRHYWAVNDITRESCQIRSIRKIEDQLRGEMDLEALQTGSRPYFDCQTYYARLRQESAQARILAL